MLACSVSARPNLIILSVFILPILLIFLIRLWKQKDRRKDLIRYVLAIAIPYLVVGVSLMILNYVRFDSITEFGAVYQLTSNDMAKLGYRAETIPIGIWHYFFNPADISLTFPFIQTRPNTPLYMGFYGSGFAGVGIFALMPISLLIFFLPVLKKHIQANYPKLWSVLLWTISIAILSAIVVTLVGASYFRYSLDFIWMMAMSGICLMVIVLELAKKEKILEKILEGFMIVFTIFTIIVSLGISVKSESNFFYYGNAKKYYEIKNSISFWE